MQGLLQFHHCSKESRHAPRVNEWTWLGSNKTLFIDTEIEFQIIITSYKILFFFFQPFKEVSKP